MKESPEKLSEVRLWIEKAENDLINAEHTLTLKKKCPFDTVCFHAQQCAEKYLKGLLVFQSIDFPKTHDLLLLLKLVPELPDFDLNPADLLLLNRYSVEARYPGDWEEIFREEAEEALLKAKKVRETVRSVLPPKAMK